VLASLVTANALTNVDDVRIGVSNERTRLVLDLSSRVDFDVFLLENPRRIVVDLPNLQWPDNLQPKPQGVIGGLRFGQFTADKSRLVLDLKQPATVSKNFILGKTSGLPVRLVIDLVAATPAQFTEQVTADRQRNRQKTASAPAPEAKPTLQTPKPKKRKAKPVIVIDPGHGGVDPGALGRKAREKNVTLSFARQFAKQLRNTGRYEVYLTRNLDIYIPLASAWRLPASIMLIYLFLFTLMLLSAHRCAACRSTLCRKPLPTKKPPPSRARKTALTLSLVLILMISRKKWRIY